MKNDTIPLIMLGCSILFTGYVLLRDPINANPENINQSNVPNENKEIANNIPNEKSISQIKFKPSTVEIEAYEINKIQTRKKLENLMDEIDAATSKAETKSLEEQRQIKNELSVVEYEISRLKTYNNLTKEEIAQIQIEKIRQILKRHSLL